MRVFYDVDTQVDFMHKNGKLYIPDAESIIPNLKKLTDYAEKNDIVIMGSADRHFQDDEELKHFPPHCMNKTKGQKKIPKTIIKNHIGYVENKVGEFGKYVEFLNDEIQIYAGNWKQLIFEKNTTDVFTNRNFKKFLDKLRVSETVVYGVATDYCIKDAVLGFLKLGIDVTLVTDAIKGINKNATSNLVNIIGKKPHKGICRLKTTREILEKK